MAQQGGLITFNPGLASFLIEMKGVAASVFLIQDIDTGL